MCVNDVITSGAEPLFFLDYIATGTLSPEAMAQVVEGIAEGTVPANTGTRAPDALNLWSAILDGSAGPRQEVVHQVENQYSCDTTQPGGGCCSSMRMGEMKLIVRRHDIAAI